MSSLLDSLSSFGRLGEAFALTSALLWAGAVILFRVSGRKVSPLGLNSFKNFLTLILFLLTMLIAREPLLAMSGWAPYALFLGSGILGIGISDTLYLASLNRLGAGPVAVVSCLHGPFIIALSMIFLGERMSSPRLLGVLLIILAVLLISSGKAHVSIPRSQLLPGVALGILAQLSTAVAIVMVKPLLDRSPLLWATLVRLCGGIVFLFPVLVLHKRKREIFSTMMDKANWKPMVPAAFIGSYLGLFAWMGGMKYTQTSIAAPLSQMSTVFIFLLAAFFLKERATPMKIVAVIVAVAGAVLATLPL